MDLRGQRVLVVGLGKSGLAAIRLLARAGAHVIANDAKDEAALGETAREARALAHEVALGGHAVELFTSVDRIVLSPGVPSNEALREAQKRGIPIASEIELASWFVSAPIVGITGTNGKSTVTTLVGEMCKRTGRPTFVGGNLGTPLVDVVGTDAARPGGLVVVELSSFQLEQVDKLRCRVATLLNVTDDHLDRYDSFAAYAAAKGRVFAGQLGDDAAVAPADDELCLSLARAGRARLHTFGLERGEVHARRGVLTDDISGLAMPVDALQIRGAHNVSNACAAALTARLAGVAPADIEAVLRSFGGLSHRMVLVRELGGVAWFDDSKATNVGAAVAALDGLDARFGRAVLIAGGVDKGGSYAPLRERLARRGRAVVLIGAAAPLIRDALAGLALPLEDATSMDDAVRRAKSLARQGDAVLLAPACASFDMFRSYAHRGDEFQRAVHALSEVRS